MKRALLSVVAAVAISACSGETSLPEATGKGSVRAINGIPTAPEIAFQIEERLLSGMVYKAATSPSDWDDLDYLFNFEYQPPGVGAARVRFATAPYRGFATSRSS